MAVQKSRVSPSKRGMRRAHDALTAKQLSTDPTSGETHLRHHVTADGYYRGKKVIETKSKVVDEDGSRAHRAGTRHMTMPVQAGIVFSCASFGLSLIHI